MTPAEPRDITGLVTDPSGAVFGTGSTNLNSASFGVVTGQDNIARQMQVALKLYW